MFSIFKNSKKNCLQEKDSLYVHEWFVISFLIALLLLLGLISHSCESQIPEVTKKKHYLKQPMFDVFIEGEVEFPGKYTVKRGAKVEELLLLAKPKYSADLRRLKKEAVLRKGQKIKILGYKMVKIFFKFKGGVVQELSVKKGTKWEDLRELYSFPLDTDFSFLKKKKVLKEGELIKIKYSK